QGLRARLAAKVDARLRQRREGNLDAVRIHHVERELWRPIRIFTERRAPPRRVDRLAVERRNEVEVNVDPARWCHHFLRRPTSPARVEFCKRPCLYARRKRGRTTVPWMDANGISIHFELAGHGPSVVLLHEMGGTLDSWDGIAPALGERFRTLRYDQRGSGLSEKVRQPITTEILVEDLEAVLQGSGLAAPYHFVTVAAATMQALIYMTRHP